MMNPGRYGGLAMIAALLSAGGRISGPLDGARPSKRPKGQQKASEPSSNRKAALYEKSLRRQARNQ